MPDTEKTGSRAFKGTLNYNNLRIDHQNQLKRLNDSLVETALAIEGLVYVIKNVNEKIKDGNINYIVNVPNKNLKSIPIRRNLKSLYKKINSDGLSYQYVKSLVFIINIVEDYISLNLIRILKSYPQKLLISTKGNPVPPGSYSVDMRDLIAAGSFEEIVSQKAEQRTRDALYASPKQYAQYFASVTGIKIEKDIWESYAEIKATRDLYVHGNGKINEIYIEKAGGKARYDLGEVAVVDAVYFDRAASCMKRLMSAIFVGLRSGYAESVELNNIFKNEYALYKL